MGDTYGVTILNNTIRNTPASGVTIQSTNSIWCVPNTGRPYPRDCIPYPASVWWSQNVFISGNNFESWGLLGGCHAFAVVVGGDRYQDVNTQVVDNTYNSAWANVPGECTDNVNSYIYCDCSNGVTINDPSIS